MAFKVKLRDIAEVVMGQSPKGENVNDIGVGFPLLNGPTEFSYRYPTPVQFTNEPTKFSKNGDILFCVRGSTTGRMNYADQQYVIGRGLAAIRGINGYPTEYIRAVIENNLDRLLASATGSTFPNIGRDLLLNLEIDTVDSNDAKKLNSFIVNVENKIELNRQINKTLETIAQFIFKSWFVDFDPVKAKQQGGDLDVIAEELGMSRSILDLFPDDFEESELGLIPKGWKVKKLSDQIEIIGGGTPKRAESRFWNGDICWFSVKDVPDDCDVFVIDTHEKITDFGLQKSSTKLLPVGTTIITARGTVGKLALTGVPMAMNQSCYGVTGKKTGQYLNYFNLKNAVDILRRNTHGAIFDTITTDTFQTVLAVESVDNINAIFENKISSIMDKVKNNLFENQALIQLRDTLLPKLLSGEITIESAEEQIN